MASEFKFGSFGRYQEVAVDQMSPEMKDAYDFTMHLRGQVPGPHKIWLANPALSKTIAPTGAYYQTKSSLTKAEMEIATNVINSRWLAAYSNFEHETIAEKQGHLPAANVQAMIAGLPTSFDDPGSRSSMSSPQRWPCLGSFLPACSSGQSSCLATKASLMSPYEWAGSPQYRSP